MIGGVIDDTMEVKFDRPDSSIVADYGNGLTPKQRQGVYHLSEIVDLNDLLVAHDVGKSTIWMRAKGLAEPRSRKVLRRIMERNCAEGTSIIEVERTELSLANSRSVLQYRVEDRVKLSRRAGDNGQYLRSCGLTLQRFVQFTSKPNDLRLLFTM